jgi:hypothetical protein
VNQEDMMAVTPIAKTTRHANVAKSVEQADAPKTARQARSEKADDATPLARAVRHLEAGEWQAAHTLVQKDASLLGCWAHGLVHLIEGDLENAKYWYRRARRPLPHGNTASAEVAALKAAVRQRTQ